MDSVTTSQGSCTETSGAVVCGLGSIIRGANATVTISILSDGGGDIVNTAEVAGNELDSILTNNTVSKTTTVVESYFCGDGDDLLLGQKDADILEGRKGNDYLQGGRGADDLFGGGGNDTLAGGNGTDFCDGGNDVDTAVTCETEVDIP
ncbi:MAG: hypothetical protein GY805_04445 [Chloroflexi bacterium]|nr:hypothetical protein [Chloroflexota bacterium]